MAQDVHKALDNTSINHLVLYVTGLTVALGEVIKYCFENIIDLTLMHYDRNTNEYYAQNIITY